MAVKIRLQRHGSKHSPVYRMVIADARARRDGRSIETIGTYNPKARGAQKELNLKIDRIDHWLAEGAQPTDTARSLIKKARKIILNPEIVEDKKPESKVSESEIAADSIPETKTEKVEEATPTPDPELSAKEEVTETDIAEAKTEESSIESEEKVVDKKAEESKPVEESKSDENKSTSEEEKK